MFFAFLLYFQSLFASSPAPIQWGNLLINVPADASSKEYPVLIAFGGSMWATPKYLWEQTPKDYFQKAIMVYSPCFIKGGQGLKKVEAELSRFLNSKHLKSGRLSVCGFSSGGPDAMIAEHPHKYAAIGLIDPSPVANGRVQHSSNMILSFRRNNWIYSDYYGKVVDFKHFNELSAAIRHAGGTVEESDIQHEVYFNYFLDKFRKQLIGS